MSFLASLHGTLLASLNYVGSQCSRLGAGACKSALARHNCACPFHFTIPESEQTGTLQNARGDHRSCRCVRRGSTCRRGSDGRSVCAQAAAAGSPSIRTGHCTYTPAACGRREARRCHSNLPAGCFAGERSAARAEVRESRYVAGVQVHSVVPKG